MVEVDKKGDEHGLQVVVAMAVPMAVARHEGFDARQDGQNVLVKQLLVGHGISRLVDSRLVEWGIVEWGIVDWQIVDW